MILEVDFAGHSRVHIYKNHSSTLEFLMDEVVSVKICVEEHCLRVPVIMVMDYSSVGKL